MDIWAESQSCGSEVRKFVGLCLFMWFIDSKENAE